MTIGIVNDMEMATKAISLTLQSSGQHQVIWTASTGEEALLKCRENRPSLVLMDLIMPGMNGVETTRRIMQECPTAILIVTASVSENCGLAFQAMGAGALDAISTPILANREGQDAFLTKIAQLSTIIKTDTQRSQAIATKINPFAPQRIEQNTKLIVLGASAGGPAALSEILSNLSYPLDAALVIIQHIDVRFVDELASWLQGFTHSPLQIAMEGNQLSHGNIYLAGKDGHIEILADRRFHYRRDLSQFAYQPSVDVFLSSVAHHWTAMAMGVILTGMGRDGAAGLLELRNRGQLTIAQDLKTSALFGMPKAAADTGAAQEILPLNKIAPRICQWMQETCPINS